MLTVIKPFCNEFHRENRMDQILSNALAGIESSSMEAESFLPKALPADWFFRPMRQDAPLLEDHW